jgi:hypothetical protein
MATVADKPSPRTDRVVWLRRRKHGFTVISPDGSRRSFAVRYAAGRNFLREASVSGWRAACFGILQMGGLTRIKACNRRCIILPGMR